ncbi:HU family DNA-binding protein [Pseudoalteromonas luteoviolacea]|uniref:Transcriptional regulator n=1 Tax=Pseudoalteromonas luteoviolacea DSM 6061 TaxID=1365250 RepID=A0A166YVN5_9GAMM|nr:HU family DNA-binding protein [Pseudoalteromonas luteoviolacea]KZN43568.1 transcriptional regulator [Pseudoalteromonas luteoviolacea DSM 6061]KZN53575.1 transcriptional regulator [Pseudoalteromonas luteoviolacea CPMOR-2]MBE0386528.1 DNA-binding protein HU-alpha [Pseudoalteromonas luteoviolacea DSM 6061]TQF71395.1 HU family DNA-binding protein [Pseudoalteromonas luteoviolacea]
MNKSELVSAMAVHSELTKKDSKAALDSILNAMTKRLSEGDPVALAGFGTLSLSYHPAKVGRNPRTGEEIMIEGQNKVLFKAAKALKDALAK